MKEIVLLFNISSKEKRLIIGKALLPLKVMVRNVPREQYNQSLGYLTGNKEMPVTSVNYEGEELKGEMLLMGGLTGAKTELVLEVMRKAGIPKTCLKAVLTDTNRFWNPPKLYDELRLEYDTMNGFS